MLDPKAVFRDSLFENIEERIKIMPAFNVTNNANLTAMCERIQHELLQEPDAVRRSKKLRAQVADLSARILQDWPA
jgi:glutamine synthetase type III